MLMESPKIVHLDIIKIKTDNQIAMVKCVAEVIIAMEVQRVQHLVSVLNVAMQGTTAQMQVAVMPSIQ